MTINDQTDEKKNDRIEGDLDIDALVARNSEKQEKDEPTELSESEAVVMAAESEKTNDYADDVETTNIESKNDSNDGNEDFESVTVNAEETKMPEDAKDVNIDDMEKVQELKQMLKELDADEEGEQRTVIVTKFDEHIELATQSDGDIIENTDDDMDIDDENAYDLDQLAENVVRDEVDIVFGRKDAKMRRDEETETDSVKAKTDSYLAEVADDVAVLRGDTNDYSDNDDIGIAMVMEFDEFIENRDDVENFFGSDIESDDVEIKFGDNGYVGKSASTIKREMQLDDDDELVLSRYERKIAEDENIAINELKDIPLKKTIHTESEQVSTLETDAGIGHADAIIDLTGMDTHKATEPKNMGILRPESYGSHSNEDTQDSAVDRIYDGQGVEIKLGDHMAFGEPYTSIGVVVGIGDGCFFTIKDSKELTADMWIIDGNDNDPGKYYHYREDSIGYIMQDVMDPAYSRQDLARRFNDVITNIRSEHGISHKQFVHDRKMKKQQAERERQQRRHIDRAFSDQIDEVFNSL